MTSTPLPAAAVVRISRGDFDPARFGEVQAMTAATGRSCRLRSGGCLA